MAQLKSIFDYLDYREYLKDHIQELRSREKFSVRQFAEQAGFKSYGYLTMVLNKSRNLSKKSAKKIAEGLRLTAKAAAFFEALVGFNQAEDLLTKDFFYNQLLEFKKFRAIRQADASQYELFSHWYHVAVLEAMGTSLRTKSTQRIAEALRIEAEEVENSIQLLLRLGFIAKDTVGWKKVDTSVKTEAQIQSLSVRKFHREMVSKALRAIDDIDRTERELSALTISLSRENFERLRKKIFEFQNEINSAYSDDQSPERIYQLNFQVFPLAFITETPIKKA